ncbi:MAG: heme-binding protein [Pseudomonadota bacterium]
MRNIYVTLHVALMGIIALAFMSTIAGANMYKGYEVPDYSVERADGPFEIRTYAPHLVAEVNTRGSRSQAASRGFRQLAGFIFGGNQQDASIAMTAPVAQVPADQGWLIRFGMPSHYDESSLPTPKDANVRIVELPADRQAIVQFTGRWNKSRLAQHEQALRAWIDAQGLTVAGPAKYYFYDDPFTLPWKRRNEIALTLN